MLVYRSDESCPFSPAGVKARIAPRS
jgi:hypothetical protein